MDDTPAEGLSPGMLAGARRLAVDAVSGEVAAALRAAGIRSILLKGPSVARWLYGEGTRTYNDSDLLVAPGDIATAEGVLASLGFTSPMAGKPGDHANEWTRAADGARVDLHRSLAGAAAEPAAVWAALSGRTETLAVGGGRLETLAPDGRALHLALHAAHHGVGAAQPLEDLGRGLERLPGEVWQGAARLASELGATPAFAAGLRLLPGGVGVADSLGLPAQAPVEVALRASSAPDTALGLERLFAARGARGKLRALGRALAPPPSLMRVWLPWTRRGRLWLAAAYAWRPFHLLGRSVPAWRAWRRARRAAG